MKNTRQTFRLEWAGREAVSKSHSGIPAVPCDTGEYKHFSAQIPSVHEI